MGAPLPTGAAVASWLARVQWSLGWRGLRAPLASVGGFTVAGPVLIAQVRGMRRSTRELSIAAILLRGLRNYYEAIGAHFDAARMSDMIVIVDVVAQSPTADWDQAMRPIPIGWGDLREAVELMGNVGASLRRMAEKQGTTFEDC